MTVLLADIGGTNLRLTLADEKGLKARTLWRAKVKDYANIDDVIMSYLKKQNVTPKAAVFVVAAPVPHQHAEIELTNHKGWAFNKKSLEQSVLAPCTLMNDWQAVGYALQRMNKRSFTPFINSVDANVEGLRLACGPGTGLGVCLWNKEISWPSEAAELPTNDLPESLSGLAKNYDQLLSGPGLMRIHKDLHGECTNSGAIVTAAQNGDANAIKTLEQYAVALATFLRYMALTTCPFGGIYLGGFLPEILPTISEEQFLEVFYGAPHQRALLESIPIFSFNVKEAGLNGAWTYAKNENIGKIFSQK